MILLILRMWLRREPNPPPGTVLFDGHPTPLWDVPGDAIEVWGPPGVRVFLSPERAFRLGVGG